VYWDGYHMGGWGFGLIGITMILILAGLIVGVILLVREFGSRSTLSERLAPPASREAEALGERFARGEIDESEFAARMAVLRSHTT